MQDDCYLRLCHHSAGVLPEAAALHDVPNPAPLNHCLSLLADALPEDVALPEAYCHSTGLGLLALRRSHLRADAPPEDEEPHDGPNSALHHRQPSPAGARLEAESRPEN